MHFEPKTITRIFISANNQNRRTGAKGGVSWD